MSGRSEFHCLAPAPKSREAWLGCQRLVKAAGERCYQHKWWCGVDHGYGYCWLKTGHKGPHVIPIGDGLVFKVTQKGKPLGYRKVES